MSELETLRAAVRDELDSLWSDLNNARYAAISGKWSMQCDFLVERIKNLTALVGPTPWESIELQLLEDGIYQRVHAEVGVHAPVDMEHVARTREQIDADRQREPRSTH